MTMTAIEIIQKAIEEAKTLYTNPHITRYKLEVEKKYADKNHLHGGDFEFGFVRYVSSYPGSRGDWSLSKSGLTNLNIWVKEGKIVAGIVLLMAGGKVIAAAPVAEVWSKVEDGPWFDYGAGEFIWVDANFEPTNTPPSSRRYLDDPDDTRPY